LSHAVGNLNYNATTLQLHLFADIKVPARLPVHVSDKVSTLIVYHHPLVEGVVFESSVFPSLLFPTQVMGKEAEVFTNHGAAAGCSA
jgi:hypothetical protein